MPEKAAGCGGPSVTVVVPCYNESGTIADCVEQLLAVGEIGCVLLIDDGSGDGTPAICGRLAERYPERVRALILPRNLGKNAAIRQGVRTVSTDYVIIFDADMTVPTAFVLRLIQILQRGPASFAYGSRMGGGQTAGMPLARRLGNRFFARWMSLLLNRRIGDVLCGLKALPRAVLAATPASACRWGDFDLFFGAADAGLDFVEVPVEYGSRPAGKSKMRAISSGLYFAFLCASRTWRVLLHQTPRRRIESA